MAEFATKMAATVIGATIGTLIFNTATSNREPSIIPPVVEVSLIPPNCTEYESSNTLIKISQFLQRDTPDSAFYLNITRIGDRQLLDKSNIDFDVDFDTVIKYFADEELCPLRLAKLIEIICYFIDEYDQDDHKPTQNKKFDEADMLAAIALSKAEYRYTNVVSEANRIKMRPHIPKIINIFKKYKNELNIAFICFRFIRFQCRTSDSDRKLFISIIQPDNELLTKMMPQNMRGQNLIDILEYHLEDAIIVEEALFAIGNIALDKTILSKFYFYIDKLINIIKKYISNAQIVEGVIFALVRISMGTSNMIKLGEFIPFIISIMEQYQNNANIIKNILDLLFHIAQTETGKIIICTTTNFNAILSASDTHIDKTIQRLTSLVLRCITAKQIIDNEETMWDYTSMLHKKIVLSIIKSKEIEYILSVALAEGLKLQEKEKELEAVANQPNNDLTMSKTYAMATMQIENEALKEEVKKLKEYIRDSNI